MPTNLFFGCCLAAAIVANASGQAFQNLDFEATLLPPSTPAGLVDPALAFPGWTVTNGNGVPFGPAVLFNTYTLGTPAQVLRGPGYTAADTSYSAEILYSSLDGRTAAFSQTGLVPMGSRSLFFSSSPFSTGRSVSLGGTTLTLISLGGDRYGADITPFAGQVLELRFARDQPVGRFQFDDIVFSPQIVPEPSTIAGLALGLGVGLLRWRWRRMA
ncbi:MAG: PEP-CTERM sorting domain-containing protein [Verrucomicrobia bacterium]|nr:PEP-CTERM sorting domain-containing protein [Verrucomicrobiota bacterium]